MHQQLPDRNILFAVLRKLRKILSHRIVHAKLPLLPKLHERSRSGNDLGQRGTVKHRVGCHRFPVRLNRAAAISLAIDHPSIVADDEHSAGSLPFGYGVVDDGIENSETRIEYSLAE